MIKNLVGIILLSFVQFCSIAQQKDSVFTAFKNGKLYALHQVKSGNDIYSIAQQYNVPAVLLGQSNDLSFYEKLSENRQLYIPLDNYNYLKEQPNNAGNAYSTLYLTIDAINANQNWPTIIGVNGDILKKWNNQKTANDLIGQAMVVGWINLNKAQKQETVQNTHTSGDNNNVITLPNTTTAKKDSIPHIPSELEKIFNYQTTNQQYIDSTSGMVVFFKPQTNVDKNLLYAFSNEFARGRVIKIKNPSNGKFVFAKVIGALPNTKQYLNAKLGLDGRAREELETREIKLWCDFFLKY